MFYQFLSLPCLFFEHLPSFPHMTYRPCLSYTPFYPLPVPTHHNQPAIPLLTPSRRQATRLDYPPPNEHHLLLHTTICITQATHIAVHFYNCRSHFAKKSKVWKGPFSPGFMAIKTNLHQICIPPSIPRYPSPVHLGHWAMLFMCIIRSGRSQPTRRKTHFGRFH